jgi:hypothetical protein
MDERSDDDLLAATRAEPEAFAVFYRRHVAALLAYFARRTRDAELAADLTAETRLGPAVSVIVTVSSEPRRWTEVHSAHADYDGMAKEIGELLEARVVTEGPAGPPIDPSRPKIVVSLGRDRMR